MTSALFDLKGRRALVTGGGRGIGRSLALALAAAGVRVALADHDLKSAEHTASLIKAHGSMSFAIECDVTNDDSVKSMVDKVVAQFGGLDIAINNAGIFTEAKDETQTLEEWNRVVAVNLTGTWLCAKAEMRQMTAQTPIGGKIINIASIAATCAISNGSYDASKAAVVHLSRTLAVQWGRFNVNVNCVSPGYVGTVFGAERSPEELRRICDVTPLGYAERLEDLHGPVLFLASKAADYVTGQNLVVDGGHTLSTWLAPAPHPVAGRSSGAVPSEAAGGLPSDP